MTEAIATTVRKVVKLPIIEIFGVVFEGEGLLAGARTHYIRLGGCQYRCLNCDSMYAVLPNQVKANASLMTPSDIVDKLFNLHGDCPWVSISGGNPTLFSLEHLIDTLHAVNYKIKMECQGDPWKDWIPKVDLVVISPKLPGFAGLEWSKVSLAAFEEFYAKVLDTKTKHIVKLVIDSEEDVEIAYNVYRRYNFETLYLSCCTHAGDTRDDLGDRYAQLGEIINKHFYNEPVDIRWLPQLHVFAFGHARGV